MTFLGSWLTRVFLTAMDAHDRPAALAIHVELLTRDWFFSSKNS